jgi:alcohol dehydrogenase
VNAERFVSHHFGFDQVLEAYDVFGRASETGALKVVIAR